MQNYALLQEVGRAGKPVLLKRGMFPTVEEWLLAAEYVLSQGNRNVVLCERGIRHFEQSTRFTLRSERGALVRELSHLPVVVDHPRGRDAGRWSGRCPWPLCGGANGLLIEVHPKRTRLSATVPSRSTSRLRRLTEQLGAWRGHGRSAGLRARLSPDSRYRSDRARGTRLLRSSRGHQVPFRVLSRNLPRARRLAPGALSYHQWQPIERGRPWVSVVEGSLALVHLASPSSNARTGRRAQTGALRQLCGGHLRTRLGGGQAASPPPVFVSASTVGYYQSDGGDRTPADESGQAGDDFLAGWRRTGAAAAHVGDFGVRQVSLRSGLVLSRRGALRRLRWAACIGFGGPVRRAGPRRPGYTWRTSWVCFCWRSTTIVPAGRSTAWPPDSVSNAQFMASVPGCSGSPSALRHPAGSPGAVPATAGRPQCRGARWRSDMTSGTRLESALRAPK